MLIDRMLFPVIGVPELQVAFFQKAFVGWFFDRPEKCLLTFSKIEVITELNI